MEEQKKNFDVLFDALAALKQYALVSDINRKIREIEELKKEVEKLSKKDDLVIFQKEVSMEFIEACDGSMFHAETGTLNKISISCSLCAKNDSSSPSDFFLSLNLSSRESSYSFIIAKNEGSNAGYLVQTKDDKLLIEDAGETFVRFLSANDFETIIYYCDQSIEKVNDFLTNDKLVRHLNAPIGSSHLLAHPLGI